MQAVIDHCRNIATYSELSGQITRTFLSPPMRRVHEYLGAWMRGLGMTTWVDHAGNLRGTYGEGKNTLLIGSHLDTVPNAGAFDGVLGVVIAIQLVELLAGERLPYRIEVIGFSEEEGVRFGVPFIGSRALIGDNTLLHRPEIAEAIHAYGVGPLEPATKYAAYLEFHIEQGPVLESLNLPVAVVDAIAGQSRLDLTFIGHANHAGTTPMALRRDSLAGAAEWILAVETAGMNDGVATVGHLELEPNARNAVNGQVLASLDVRHADDAKRHATVQRLVATAQAISAKRELNVTAQLNLDQPAVPLHAGLTEQLACAAGPNAHRMTSGAGHDAMILAPHMPTAMLFLRSPGGISHHPDETVRVDDVAAALEVGMRFLRDFHV